MPDLVTSKTFVDGEKGITAAKMNQIISGAVIQPAFYSAKPSTSTLDPTDVLLDLKGSGSFAQITGAQIASSVAGQLVLADATQNGMLRQVSGLATDVVDGTNHCVPIASMAGITQMRLRSFNALGNSVFEIDQRNIGNALTNPANGSFIQDRWSVFKSAGLTGTVNTALQLVPTAPIVIPGTSFAITQAYQKFTVGTAQASLAAADFWGISQTIEGPRWRELSMDVHSVSILVQSSVARTFALRLRDPTSTHSLVTLCTVPANVWTLITLPNFPVWVGTYTASPGNAGYIFDIFLACGSNYLTAANAAWQTGDVRGVTGMSNFLATSGATFSIAFTQHEPGALCTTPQDLPFNHNLDDCLRYYQKSYNYAVLPGTASNPGRRTFLVLGAFAAGSGVMSFYKPMAKVPTVVLFNHATGAASSVRDGAGVDHSSASASIIGETGFDTIGFTTAVTSAMQIYTHYIADTGW